MYVRVSWGAPRWTIGGLQGAPAGHNDGLLGGSWELLGGLSGPLKDLRAPREPLGGSLGHLGCLLDRLGAFLNSLGSLMGHGGLLGRLGALLGASWAVLERYCCLHSTTYGKLMMLPSRGPLGLACLGALSVASWALGPSGGHLGSLGRLAGLAGTMSQSLGPFEFWTCRAGIYTPGHCQCFSGSASGGSCCRLARGSGPPPPSGAEALRLCNYRGLLLLLLLLSFASSATIARRLRGAFLLAHPPEGMPPAPQALGCVRTPALGP